MQEDGLKSDTLSLCRDAGGRQSVRFGDLHVYPRGNEAEPHLSMEIWQGNSGILSWGFRYHRIIGSNLLHEVIVLRRLSWIAIASLQLTVGQPAHIRAQAPDGPITAEVAVPGHRGDAPVASDALRVWRTWLLERGYGVSRCGHRHANGTFVVDIESETALEGLTDEGFTIIKRLDRGPLNLARTPSEYFDPIEIETELTDIAAAFPSITQLLVIGTTFEGRQIFGLEISDQPGIAEDEPAIQFNGQHHAREVATSHVVMDVVQTLTAGYGTDPTITDWVNRYKTVCVPMVNPDGVQHVFDVNASWRRNRQVHPGCVGVDLNRNYPYLWGPGCGSSGSCNDLYRGPAVASENETQAMIALAQSYHFTMATSYHAFGRFIDYPYACSDGSPAEQMPEHQVIDDMMHGVADAIFAVDGVDYTVHSPAPAGGVNGDDTSWYYAAAGTYSFIIEVGTTFEPAFASVEGIINRNRGGWNYLYQRLGEARLDVHVTDGCSQQPMEADVTITDYIFDTGESARTTYLPFGRWSFLVTPGDNYTVRVSETGFVAQEITIPVGSLPVNLSIQLEPVATGDINNDGLIDLIDYSAFEDCLAGPDMPPDPTGPMTDGECKTAFDFDRDGDIDGKDFATWQVHFGEP